MSSHRSIGTWSKADLGYAGPKECLYLQISFWKTLKRVTFIVSALAYMHIAKHLDDVLSKAQTMQFEILDSIQSPSPTRGLCRSSECRNQNRHQSTPTRKTRISESINTPPPLRRSIELSIPKEPQRTTNIVRIVEIADGTYVICQKSQRWVSNPLCPICVLVFARKTLVTLHRSALHRLSALCSSGPSFRGSE